MAATTILGFDQDAVKNLYLFTRALSFVGVGDANNPTVQTIIEAIDDEAGQPKVAELATTKESEFEEEVINIFFQVKYNDDGTKVERTPSLSLRNKVRLAREICVEWVKLQSKDTTQPQTHTPPLTPTPPISTVTSRKLKLKDLVDQITEEEADLLTDVQVAACYAKFEALMGEDEEPGREEDPTIEQLSAVQHLLTTGTSPYVDFGIFGPYGHRILRKVKLTGVKWNASNELARIEINGPATYDLVR